MPNLPFDLAFVALLLAFVTMVQPDDRAAPVTWLLIVVVMLAFMVLTLLPMIPHHRIGVGQRWRLTQRSANNPLTLHREVPQSDCLGLFQPFSGYAVRKGNSLVAFYQQVRLVDCFILQVLTPFGVS